MKVLLKEFELLNMKEIESWLQHGPESVPVQREGFNWFVPFVILAASHVVIILIHILK